MLENAFADIYLKFKLQFYQRMFSQPQDLPDSLTTVESICMETILALNRPSVNQFAAFLGISQPNAAYKVSQLIRKGYLKKLRSQRDKREFYLIPTVKYMRQYKSSNAYVQVVLDRVRERFSAQELRQLESALEIIGSELMPEMPALITSRRKPAQR